MSAIPPGQIQYVEVPRKRGCLGKLFIGAAAVFGVLIVLAVIASMLGGNDTGTPTASRSSQSEQIAVAEPGGAPEAAVLPSPTSEPPTPTPVPMIGQDVIVEPMRWKVLQAVDEGNTLKSDNEFIEPKTTGGKFIRVTFELENLDKDQRSFLSVDLVDGQGRRFSPYTDAAFGYIDSDLLCALDVLNPNVPQTCEHVYEVPADATGLMLEATDVGLFGGEVLIDLQL